MASRRCCPCVTDAHPYIRVAVQLLHSHGQVAEYTRRKLHIVQIGAIFNLWFPFLSGLLMLLFSDPKISWMRKPFFLFLLESAKFRDKIPLQNWESVLVSPFRNKDDIFLKIETLFSVSLYLKCERTQTP